MDTSDKEEKDFRFTKDNHFFTIFIFPFKYFNHGEKEPVSPCKMANHFVASGGGNVWEEKPFTVSDALEYNEWHYFYPYVRSMLFKENQKEKEGIRYLRRKDYNEATKAELLVQFYGSDQKIRSVKTDVNSVDLHLFDNQIGLLSITTECGNTDYGMEDFLRYNDTARRVYPPFLGEAENKAESIGKTSAPKENNILPYSVTLLAPGKAPVEERFPDLQLPDKKLYLSRVVRDLLSPIMFNDGTEIPKEEYAYDSFTDDRMFIVSYYRNDVLGSGLSKYCCGQYSYENSNEWYSMIFVEGNPKDVTIKNDPMKRELLHKHSYARWADKGTLYGMSRYSLVFVGRNGWFEQNMLYTHMKSMYYQMALIILFQRAMLVKFSEEIKNLTKYFTSGQSDREFRAKADQLHGNFIKFTNEYWYTEVTPQEQGIEMYRQWMDLVGHDYLYAKVKGEISELATHVRTMIEHESNQNIELITKMGLPLSVVIAVMTVWLAIYGERHVPDLLPYIVHLRIDPWQVILSVIFAISGAISLFQLGKFICRYVTLWFRKSRT